MRSTAEAIKSIVSSLQWLGLNWDEGPEVGGTYGPYRQTERVSLYQQAVNELFERRRAYYCFCTPDELKRRRKEALAAGNPPKYDGRCSKLSENEVEALKAERKLAAVRFRVPKAGTTVVNDSIRGKVRFENELLGDFILLRADGTYSYI